MEYEDRVRISTPEGVDVELTLAGIGSRFIAAIFDFIIQCSIVIAAASILHEYVTMEPITRPFFAAPATAAVDAFAADAAKHPVFLLRPLPTTND